MFKKFHEVANANIKKDIKVIHKNYLSRIRNYYQISDDDLNRFSWVTGKKVLIFLIKVFNDNIYGYSTIVFAKPSNVNKILELNLVKETHQPSFGRIQDAAIKKRLNWIISQKLVSSRLLNNIIMSSLNYGYGTIREIGSRWYKEWVDHEYDSTLKLEQNSTSINYFPKTEQKYFFDRYHFKDMLNVIGNPQFSDELGQCIFAYEKQKWFLCASGLGSCLEHLMYIILNNYNKKGYKTLQSFPKMATANSYIERFKRYPINIDSRQATAIQLFFMARNSVDHFNTGKTQRIFCDLLFDGI